MTGGASKKSKPLLNRKQELETLQLKIGEMEENERLERSLKNKKQAYHIQVEKVQSLREKGELLRQDERGLKDQLKEINWNENNLNEKLSLYDSEDRAYKNEVAQIEHQNLMNEKEIEQIQIKVQEIDQMIHELSNKRNIDMSKKTEIVEEINELKVSLAKKEENLKNCESQLTALKNRQAEIKQSLTNNEKELALLVAEMESNFSGASQLEREAEQKLYDKKQTLELIAERRKQRHEFQQTLEDLEQDLKELKRQYNYFQQTLKEEEVKLNRLDVELDNHLTTLREEYMLTYEGARSEYPLTIPYEEAKKKVKLIKLAIDELGTVNLGAIDEFERVSERFKFLSEQKADLQQAKETLYQVIEEMDEEMIKRFTETFTAIKAEFDNVFQSLFGGGKAELQLTDPTDLLNTGIEIIAQPPGKNYKIFIYYLVVNDVNSNRLTFSIIKTRPVPFCILDEVEAASMKQCLPF